mmetsp:Transcript_20012/g.63728  ORF Transcript_20012/g.63728 Transcript_20012/m.63728 type:complete len:391 (-) Transcript_20012:198-1370(-)
MRIAAAYHVALYSLLSSARGRCKLAARSCHVSTNPSSLGRARARARAHTVRRRRRHLGHRAVAIPVGMRVEGAVAGQAQSRVSAQSRVRHQRVEARAHVVAHARNLRRHRHQTRHLRVHRRARSGLHEERVGATAHAKAHAWGHRHAHTLAHAHAHAHRLAHARTRGRDDTVRREAEARVHAERVGRRRPRAWAVRVERVRRHAVRAERVGAHQRGHVGHVLHGAVRRHLPRPVLLHHLGVPLLRERRHRAPRAVRLRHLQRERVGRHRPHRVHAVLPRRAVVVHRRAEPTRVQERAERAKAGRGARAPDRSVGTREAAIVRRPEVRDAIAHRAAVLVRAGGDGRLGSRLGAPSLAQLHLGLRETHLGERILRLSLRHTRCGVPALGLEQ